VVAFGIDMNLGLRTQDLDFDMTVMDHFGVFDLKER